MDGRRLNYYRLNPAVSPLLHVPCVFIVRCVVVKGGKVW